MINKLLLVRVKDSRSDLLDKAGVKQFAGEPLKVTPRAWPDDAGLTHYGFVLTDLSLEDWQALQKWETDHGSITVLDHAGSVDETLASVGLRINKSAKD